MKPILTNPEITRLAYSEASLIEFSEKRDNVNREYALLKGMQKIVDQCVAEPSRQSVDKILAALNSI